MFLSQDKSKTFWKRFSTLESAFLGPRSSALFRQTLDCDQLKASLDEYLLEYPEQKFRRPWLLSAVYLWHDHLDAAHNISEDLKDNFGSWIHAIMHRREPDFSNAKYWCKRCDTFILEKVGTNLPMINAKAWTPVVFVDVCEQLSAFEEKIVENSEKLDKSELLKKSEADASFELWQEARSIQELEFQLLIEELLVPKMD